MMTTPEITSDVDLFSDEVLRDPYPSYAKLRELGPVVYLERLDAWALTRHEHIRAALHDWERFSSVGGVGLNETINGFLAGSVLGTDPPEHDVLRSVLSAQLAPRALRSITQKVERQAADLIGDLGERGGFDAVADLAAALPLSVVFELIGLPEEARPKMLGWADGAFTVFGPMNDRTQTGLPVIGEMFAWLATLEPHDLTPGSMGRGIFDAAAAGQIGRESCVPLLAAFTTAGMDTTINSIANAVQLFATHQDQWRQLRADPELIPSAFAEILRYDSPVQAFGRLVKKGIDIDGVELGPGSQAVLLFGSGNRDERRYEQPDRFDLTRNPVDHLSFGYGVHACVGQALARIEAHSVLKAMVAKVERIEVGEPVRHLNNVIRGLESLPDSRFHMASSA